MKKAIIPSRNYVPAKASGNGTIRSLMLMMIAGALIALAI